MTLGQILFILVVLMISSLMFFYLGTKFGANVLRLGSRGLVEGTESFLPDERLAEEVNQILATHTDALVFHDAVQTGGNAMVLKSDPVMPVEPKSVEVKPVTQPVAPVVKLATSKTETPTVPKSETSAKIIETAPLQKIPPNVTLPEKTVAYTVPESAALVMPVQAQSVTHTPEAPVETLPVKETQNYRLQLGSYADSARATQAKMDWEKRGFRVNIVKSVIPGKGTWYRLNLGNYTSKSEAEEAQRQIMQKYQQTAMILQ